MLDRAELKQLRDSRGFRKAMVANKNWVMLTCTLNRVGENRDECYYEIEKHEFFTEESGKKEGKATFLTHGECAWSAEAFDGELKPIWEGFIAEHKADDYFVDDWEAIEPIQDAAKAPSGIDAEVDDFWNEISDDGVKYNCSSPE